MNDWQRELIDKLANLIEAVNDLEKRVEALENAKKEK